MPIAAIIKGQTYAIHSDHLNTPRRLTQADGQAAWQWAYSAFGEEQPTTGAKRFTSEVTTPSTGSTSIPEVTFNLRYPGQYFDSETKLHYNWNRSYDSRTGRYTQGDPIGLDGGWNRFAYVGGNSLSFVDPDGRNPLLIVGGIVLTGYGTYSTLKDVQSCKKTCEMTQGDAVQACEPERRDIVESDKFRRIENCKARCALTSIFDLVWQNYSMPK